MGVFPDVQQQTVFLWGKKPKDMKTNICTLLEFKPWSSSQQPNHSTDCMAPKCFSQL
jgi:hypothetical protein